MFICIKLQSLKSCSGLHDLCKYSIALSKFTLKCRSMNVISKDLTRGIK